jgi:ActR/RegA family two-component response regulator
MSFFSKAVKSTIAAKTGIIFIVEDNAMYAKTLEAAIKSDFPEVKQIKIFPVGETCLLDLHKNPDLIIIDYFLDSKYEDAETGLEIIKQIRAVKPDLKIIVLSGQSDIEVVVDAVKKYNCNYVKKDDDAFSKVAEIIRGMN